MTPFVGLHDHAADDIGGHKIRCELDALVPEAQGASQSPQQGRLSKSRNSFQKNMAARHKADENAVDDALLTDNNLAYFPADEV
jgi:hypothetical protein